MPFKNSMKKKRLVKIHNISSKGIYKLIIKIPKLNSRVRFKDDDELNNLNKIYMIEKWFEYKDLHDKLFRTRNEKI